MKIGKKCIIRSSEEGYFRPYTTYIKNIKDSIIVLDFNSNTHFHAGNNLIVEIKKKFELKRYKATVRSSASIA